MKHSRVITFTSYYIRGNTTLCVKTLLTQTGHAQTAMKIPRVQMVSYWVCK